MSATAASVEALLAEMVKQAVERAVAPLKLEIERLRSERSSLVTMPEAAQRLGVTVRAVQRWAKDGRLEVVPVAGVRMIRLPDGSGSP